MSGWTAATVHPPKGLSADARKKAEKSIEQRLQDEHGEYADGYAERTVQLARNCDHETEAQALFDLCPEAKFVAIMSCNDTSDSGYGSVYEIDEGDIIEQFRKIGYEGAKGEDVRGEINEKFGLRSYTSWEA